jgi:YHS domain-containing protein
MFRRIAAVALSLFCVTTPLRAQTRAQPEALDGVDVVTLLTTGKEVFGKSAHRSTFEGIDYLFESADTKAAFDKAPSKYAIQLGGICARMGGMVRGNPADYAVHDGRIYIFGSDDCHKAFVSDPEKYIPPPAPPMPSSPGAMARGRALLDKAAAAHGGPALEAATSYVETVTTMQKRATGEVAVVTRNLWRFPDAARTERTIPLNTGPATFTTVMTASAAWGIGLNGQTTPMPPGMRPAAQVQFGRRLLPILKTRNNVDVAVAALEPAAINGVAVERLRVRADAIDVTLNIDGASGRVHSLSYVDRGDSGQFCDILVVFDDDREVNGVRVPFVESGTCNAAPSAAHSRRLDSAELNVPLDPALFTPPAEIGR